MVNKIVVCFVVCFSFGVGSLGCSNASVGASSNIAQDIASKPTELTSNVPVRIILNLTTDPARSMAVAWRTSAEVKNPQVQVAEAEEWIGFAKKARTIIATAENIPLEKGQLVSYYAALMDSLETKNSLRISRGRRFSME